MTYTLFLDWCRTGHMFGHFQVNEHALSFYQLGQDILLSMVLLALVYLNVLLPLSKLKKRKALI